MLAQIDACALMIFEKQLCQYFVPGCLPPPGFLRLSDSTNAQYFYWPVRLQRGRVQRARRTSRVSCLSPSHLSVTPSWKLRCSASQQINNWTVEIRSAVFILSCCKLSCDYWFQCAIQPVLVNQLRHRQRLSGECFLPSSLDCVCVIVICINNAQNFTLL